MSKQSIKIVKEFNHWRKKRIELVPINLNEALDEVVKMAERYEFLRTLTPHEFKELWKRNISGEGYFDSLVDKLIESR